jgi:hypothetical protein
VNVKWRKSYFANHLCLAVFALCASSGLVSEQEEGPNVTDASVTPAQTTDNFQPIGNVGEVPAVAPPRRQSALRRFVTRVSGGETSPPDRVSPTGVPLATAPGSFDDLPPLPAAGPGENAAGGADRPADAAGTAAADGGATRGSQAVSSNPGAVDIIAGTGALGRALGLSADSGIRLGGVWVGDTSGVSGFYQFGANDNNAMRARDYVGGGLTAFGLVPGRPDDSFGFGIAWTALNQNPTAGNLFFPSGDHTLRSNQLMLEWYYQMKLVNGIFFQTALTEIPNPGLSASFPSAFAITLRVIALF